MPGRILIIDTVATNRIVLKAKMLAAHFMVDTCGSTAAATKRIVSSPPDLILINLSDPVEDRHGFCKTLRTTPATAGIGIIVVGVADTAMARFAALDAGADDVLPVPLNDTLMLARIRSLLRVHSTGQDITIRATHSRALGFEEGSNPFLPADRIVLVSDAPSDHDAVLAKLNDGLQQKIRLVPIANILSEAKITPPPDLVVVTLRPGKTTQDVLHDIVDHMRGRTDTADAAQLVVLPGYQPEAAAHLLDAGADAVVTDNCTTSELALRAKALLRQKRRADLVQVTTANGFHAAIGKVTGLETTDN